MSDPAKLGTAKSLQSHPFLQARALSCSFACFLAHVSCSCLVSALSVNR
jgi:hypothetical protein